MAKKRSTRRRNPQAQAITKAPMGRNLEGAAMSSAEVLAAAFAAGHAAAAQTATPMPRDTFPYAFGPGIPTLPAPLDPVREDSGRAEPRIFEYDVSWNLPDSGTRHRLVPWKTLRDAADNIPLFRRCIEIRKQETVATAWDITLTKRAVQTAQRNSPDKPRHQVEADLRNSLDADIDRLTQFWTMPDRGNGYTFTEWLSQFIEEHLVLDAVSIYPRYTFGGDLYSLELLDGSTIKPLLDHRGGRPTPPNPAYQQILHGFPRGEFTADANGDAINNGYPSDQLIYIRRAVRTWTPYGYSAVEQALNDGDLYMRRYQWLKSEYTDGVMPSGWLKHAPGSQTSWTPQQLLEYERDFNDFYSGSTANRRRFRILPPGLEPSEGPDVAERYKPEYDLHLIKLLASHFDVTLAELGFTEQGGLGSTGWHDGQAEVQDRKGTMPILRWLASILTDISRQHLGMPDELEFRWPILDEDGSDESDNEAQGRIDGARSTINEERDREGKPRFDFPEADMPFIRTSRGLVFLDGASQLAPPGEVIDQVAGAPLTDADSDGILDAPHGPDTDIGPGPAASSGETSGEGDSTEEGGDGRQEQVKAELAAYRRWARKNPHPKRPFEFTTVTKADAPDLDQNSVAFADPGGDSGPKAPAPGPTTWPGWGPDLQAVDYWAPRIQTAVRGTLDTPALAQQWQATHPPTATTTGTTSASQQDTDSSDALAWLTAIGAAAALTTALGLLPALHREGWTIGHRAARTLLDGRPPHDTWRPGHPETPAGETATALQSLIQQADRLIRGIANTRLRRLARILGQSRTRGHSTETLAQALTDVLNDANWARAVATTEISRGSAAGATDTYRAAGIHRIAWLAEADTKTCPTCLGNAAADPRPAGTAFPSGDAFPPAHPSCRCTPIPA